MGHIDLWDVSCQVACVQKKKKIETIQLQAKCTHIVLNGPLKILFLFFLGYKIAVKHS